MIEQLRSEILELARAISGLDRQHETQAILHRMEEMEKRIMATLKDLDDEIQGDLNDAATGIENALTAALAKITVPADVQPQIDHIKAIAAALKTAAQGSAPTVTVPPGPPAP